MYAIKILQCACVRPPYANSNLPPWQEGIPVRVASSDGHSNQGKASLPSKRIQRKWGMHRRTSSTNNTIIFFMNKTCTQEDVQHSTWIVTEAAKCKMQKSRMLCRANMPHLQIDVRVTSDNTVISLGPAPAKLCFHMRTCSTWKGCRSWLKQLTTKTEKYWLRNLFHN